MSIHEQGDSAQDFMRNKSLWMRNPGFCDDCGLELTETRIGRCTECEMEHVQLNEDMYLTQEGYAV